MDINLGSNSKGSPMGGNLLSGSAGGFGSNIFNFPPKPASNPFSITQPTSNQTGTNSASPTKFAQPPANNGNTENKPFNPFSNANIPNSSNPTALLSVPTTSTSGMPKSTQPGFSNKMFEGLLPDSQSKSSSNIVTPKPNLATLNTLGTSFPSPTAATMASSLVHSTQASTEKTQVASNVLDQQPNIGPKTVHKDGFSLTLTETMPKFKKVSSSFKNKNDKKSIVIPDEIKKTFDTGIVCTVSLGHFEVRKAADPDFSLTEKFANTKKMLENLPKPPKEFNFLEETQAHTEIAEKIQETRRKAAKIRNCVDFYSNNDVTSIIQADLSQIDESLFTLKARKQFEEDAPQRRASSSIRIESATIDNPFSKQMMPTQHNVSQQMMNFPQLRPQQQPQQQQQQQQQQPQQQRQEQQQKQQQQPQPQPTQPRKLVKADSTKA